MNIESIRELIRDNPRDQRGYPQKIREAVVHYAVRRRAEGIPWGLLEPEIGISRTSIRTWARALHSADASGAGFHEVVVVDSLEQACERGLVLTSPSGFVLTGCSVEQAALLLRRLQ